MSISLLPRFSGNRVFAFTLLLLLGVGGCSSLRRGTERSVTISEFSLLPSDAQGFPLSFGSGIACRPSNRVDEVLCVGITDRGPGIEGPRVVHADGTESPSMVFERPQFSPHLVEFLLTKSGVSLVQSRPLITPTGKRISGIPRTQGVLGATGETPLSLTLVAVPYDDDGLDPEALAFDSDGTLWGCDEYGPFLFTLDVATGRVDIRGSPGNLLPTEFGLRRANRGCEAISVTPGGAILLSLQSPVRVADSKANEPAVRFVWISSDKKETRELLYPVQRLHSSQPQDDLKIGDLVAIDERSFLAIETRTPSGSPPQITIVRLTLPPEGREISYETLLSLTEQGWSHGKAEGLALLPSRQELLIASDSDFGREYRSLINFGVLAVRAQERSNGSHGGRIAPGQLSFERRPGKGSPLVASEESDSELFVKSVVEPISVVPRDAATYLWKVTLWSSIDRL